MTNTPTSRVGELSAVNNLCATEGCGRQGTVRFERGGVGSDYCPGCAASIEVLFRNDQPVMLSEVRKVIYRIAGQLKGQIPEQVLWGLADSIESHALTSPAQETVTDDMVEAAARAFDPFSFASWQQSYDYEMAKSSDEAEAKAFADWCMGKRIDEARSGARAALTAALSSKGA